VKAQLALLVLDVHTVQSQNVQMAIESERTVGAFHHDDQARQCLADTSQPELCLGLALE
jgi:hypothetical protein